MMFCEAFAKTFAPSLDYFPGLAGAGIAMRPV